MPLETGNEIQDLVPTNPVSTDNVAQGDDHLRLIKTCIQGSFPNMTAPWTTSNAIAHGNATADGQSATLGQVNALIAKRSWGRVAANGAILEGTGDFSVNKTGTGTDTITFNNAAPSANEQAFLLQPLFGGIVFTIANYNVPTANTVQVLTGVIDPAGGADSEFCFMRVIP